MPFLYDSNLKEKKTRLNKRTDTHNWMEQGSVSQSVYPPYRAIFHACICQSYYFFGVSALVICVFFAKEDNPSIDPIET